MMISVYGGNHVQDVKVYATESNATGRFHAFFTGNVQKSPVPVSGVKLKFGLRPRRSGLGLDLALGSGIGLSLRKDKSYSNVCSACWKSM